MTLEEATLLAIVPGLIVLVGAIVADCMKTSVLIIGATNRSLGGFNNTLCLSPAFVCTRSDIDELVAGVDVAITRALAE